MSILTDSSKKKTQAKPESKKKSQNTRGYLLGRQMSESQMIEAVVRLSQKLKISEIMKETGKSRSTIERLLKKAKIQGKILTTESGRITLPEDELAKRQYTQLTKDDLYEKYQPVKKMD